MKIAFLIRSLACGGAERQLVLLATGLYRAGHAVSVHVFYPGGEFEPALRQAGVRVNVIGKRGRWDSLGFSRRVIKGLREENADIIHAYLGNANIVSGLLKRWLRPARIVWGIRNSQVDFREYDWLFGVTARIESRLASTSDLVISNSKAGRDQAVRRRFPAERIVIVPNGVDLAVFFKDSAARARIRKQWRFTEKDNVIGRVGRLDPVKDYPGFLRAAALASQRDPRLKFVCIGSGSPVYLASLRQFASELGIAERVLWVGQIREMCDAYNGLDLLVSSSVSEGFPNVLLEAMACGIPCVTTDSGDAGEIVNGTGITVPHSDARALAHACLRLLECRPPADRIRRTVETRYSLGLLLQRTELHLAKLLATIPNHPKTTFSAG